MRFTTLVIFVLFIITSCIKSGSKERLAYKSSNANNIEVEVYIVAPMQFRKQIFSSGRITCSDYAPIFFDKDGIVKKIYAENGQVVSKGDLIAELDHKKDSIQLQIASNQIEMAQIEYKNLLLGRDLSRYKKDSAQNLKRSLQLQSGLIEAKTNWKLKKMQYESNFLYAPQAGSISGLTCQKNHKINASKNIGMILNLEFLKIDFFLMEDDRRYIEKGQKIKAFSPSLKDSLDATIVHFDQHVSDDGMFHVTANVINKNPEALLHNMTVNILCGKTIPHAITIPKQAVVRKNEEQVVFTLVNNTARWNNIQIIDQNKSFYQIGSGLRIGDTVIISNNLLLDDGSRVKIKKK